MCNFFLNRNIERLVKEYKNTFNKESFSPQNDGLNKINEILDNNSFIVVAERIRDDEKWSRYVFYFVRYIKEYRFTECHDWIISLKERTVRIVCEFNKDRATNKIYVSELDSNIFRMIADDQLKPFTFIDLHYLTILNYFLNENNRLKNFIISLKKKN